MSRINMLMSLVFTTSKEMSSQSKWIVKVASSRTKKWGPPSCSGCRGHTCQGVDASIKSAESLAI